MARISLLLCVVAFACGGSSTPPPATPLPPVVASSSDEVAKPVEPTPPAKEEEPPAPPAGPINLAIEPQDIKVKLVSPGKGTRSKLTYAPKQAGAKQQVELAIDFSAKETGPEGTKENGMPTIVLGGEGEAKAADKDGSEHALVVTGVDARAVAGRDSVPLDKLKELLVTAKGLTISGKVAPNGTSVGETKLAIEKGDGFAAQVMQLVQITAPSWPVVPAEAIGVGAKWQATSTTKLMGQVAVTIVTDYEVTAKKDAEWTIKGKTKLSGIDQDLAGNKFTGIQGTGSTEATVVQGALYPTFTTKLDAGFTVAAGTDTMKLGLSIGVAMKAS